VVVAVPAGVEDDQENMVVDDKKEKEGKFCARGGSCVCVFCALSFESVGLAVIALRDLSRTYGSTQRRCE
jgi:hypothetical protein